MTVIVPARPSLSTTHRIHDTDHPVVGRVSAQQIVAPAPGDPNYEASVMGGYATLEHHQRHHQQPQHAVTFRITEVQQRLP